MLYSGDGWVDEIEGPQSFRRPTIGTSLNEKQLPAGNCWEVKVPQSAHPAIRPYLKNALYLNQENPPMHEAMGNAMGALEEEEGSSKQSREENVA